MFVVFLYCFIVTVTSNQLNRERIPNGYIVPDPCSANHDGVWSAVGHTSKDHGGPTENHLNDFGRDFRANGYVWNPTLCRLDSDGDGVDNGHELGDPDCTWVMNGGFPKEDPSGHPGINEMAYPC